MDAINNNHSLKDYIHIIVPVYNVEKYIDRCIQSILLQTYSHYRVILVDDGSTDGSGAICDLYANKYESIVAIHKNNEGLSSARNAGIDYVLQNHYSGYITFIDSDDWIHAAYLECLYVACIQDGTNISVCRFKKIYLDQCEDDMKVNTKSRVLSPEDLWCADQVNATVAWGKLYRVHYFIETHFPVGKYHEDEFTTYKLLFSTAKISFVESELYYYYQNEQSIMNKKWSPKRLDVIEAIENQISFFEKKRFYKAKLVSELNYVWSLYKGLINCKEHYGEFVLLLSYKLKRAMWSYSKDLNITIKSDRTLFRCAFPLYTRIYEYMEHIWAYIRKMLRK